jgi:RTX calcium-binding nonapeptide repeat (4 copies)
MAVLNHPRGRRSIRGLSGRLGNLERATAVVGLTALLAVAAMVGAERAEAAATCAGQKATVVGTNGANVLLGTNQADVIVARGGNDTIKGKGGADLICAGDGNDYVDGGPVHDVVRGDAGHDTCVSSPGGGVDKFVSCEDRTAFDLQIDDGLDWGETLDVAGNEPLPGADVVTTLNFGAGGIGHAGYKRTLISPQGLVPGVPTALDFGTALDDNAVSVALPFSMPFFGISYDVVSVSTNGWVAFGGPAIDYLGDNQFTDYRGFAYGVGGFDRGAMPYWGDFDLNGGGSVSVTSDTHSVAIQWDAGEFSANEPPHRVLQLVLFDDGRMRYDYISETAPDANPNPGFIGLSDGSGPRGLNTVGRSGYTYLTADVTLPQTALPVVSTAGFKMPGTVVVSYDTSVTCTAKTATAFTGCTGGTGSYSAKDVVHQLLPLPAKSVLYTPIDAPAIAAPAGTVAMTLPRGSTYVGSSLTCPKVVAPTATKDGFARCAVPHVSLGTNTSGTITWKVPPNVGNGQTTPPNVGLRATYAPAGSPRSVDLEEALFAGDSGSTTLAPDLVYTGPSPAHVSDALTFTTNGHPGDNLAHPVVEIVIPLGMKLNSTTFPACGPKPSGFGGGSVFCVPPNGITNAYVGTLTFHVNHAATYKPKVRYFADNAPTAGKTATLGVLP